MVSAAYQAALFNLLGILQFPSTILGYGNNNHQYGNNNHQYGNKNHQYGNNNHQYGYNNHQRSCHKSTVDPSKVADCSYNPVDNLFKYTSLDIHNKSVINFADYQGKVSLVANVATF